MRRSSIIALASITAIAAPASAQATSTDALVQAAREAGRANRHDEAIKAFRNAIMLAPERRREWLIELADQLTWSERTSEAIPLYREAIRTQGNEGARKAHVGLGRALSWLGKHREAVSEYDRALAIAPEDRSVRLARAQVLSWDDRLGAALAAYDSILQDHPDDIDARRGRVRMLGWRGRHRAAVTEAKRLLLDHPGDREATRMLVETLEWMGRPDRAREILRDQLATRPGDDDLDILSHELNRRHRPETRMDWRSFDQSDDLAIDELTLALRVPIAAARGSAGMRYARAVYRPGDEAGRRITVDRPSIHASFRLSDALELTGAASIDKIRQRGGIEASRFTFDTYATVRPNDLLRIDLGVSRYTFDSEATLAIALTGTQYGASVDLQPDQKTMLSGRISTTDFSDGNHRFWWQLEAQRRISNTPRVSIGYRYTNFDFRLSGRPGYYNPDRFQGHELVVRGTGQMTRTLRWDARLAGGVEREPGSRPRTTINAGAGLAQRLGERLEIEAAYDFSTSRTQSSGGFERGIARVSLRARF